MSHVFTAEKVYRPRMDPLLLLSVILLALMGLVVLFSASYYRSETLYDSPFVFFTNQCIYAILGFIAAIIISRFKIEQLQKIIPILVISALVLMLLTFVVGIGALFLGGRRWIVIGSFSFQPSELVKLVLVLYIASFFYKRRSLSTESFVPILPPLVVTFLFAFLIYLQNNFSVAAFVAGLGLLMLFIAGVKLSHFILALAIIIPLGVGAVLAKDYRIERLSTFVEPSKDPSGSGYQVLSAQAAIKSGDLLGKGMGMGERKLGQLPEAQSDYIFAVASEELGFGGVVGILGLFGFFAYRGYRLMLLSTNVFDRILAFGATTSICLQALLNIGVTGGIIPPTGIPLPFFSAGGSSLFLTFCMVGILLNVSTRIKEEAGRDD